MFHRCNYLAALRLSILVYHVPFLAGAGGQCAENHVKLAHGLLWRHGKVPAGLLDFRELRGAGGEPGWPLFHHAGDYVSGGHVVSLPALYQPKYLTLVRGSNIEAEDQVLIFRRLEYSLVKM